MSVLEDKDAIREIMAAYCHALDACRFADVASLFADDGVWTTDYGEAKGRGAIEEMLRGIVPVKGEGPSASTTSPTSSSRWMATAPNRSPTTWSCASLGRI
jgi:uncharacterized protein (TIGR02246 family)